MALIIADRVKETATTTGTGTFTLGGAVTGFRTFNAGIGTGNTTYYCIFLDGTNEFEVGLGTYTAPDQLARDTVLASSNSGSKVNFSQGIKSVFCTQPSSKAAYLDASGNLSITTSNITEGTNLYYTDTRFDTRLATKDTADLSEGTNLYYTDARARAAISVSGNAIAYNSSTGVITANFEESPTFTGNVVVSGNLTVTGTTTWLDSTNTQISDKNIVLNYASGDSSANADGAGITIQDAVDASTDASLTWNATNDVFEFSHGLDFGDNEKIRFGASQDLEIYHSGSESKIVDTGSGGIRLQSDAQFIISNAAGTEDKAKFFTDGAVQLFHNNSIKFATSSTGIDVSGTISSGAITSTGTSSFSTIGIGTASPQRRLTIGGGTGSEILSIYGGTGSSSAIHFTDTNTSTDYQGFVTYNHSADALRLGTAENERLRIDSSGNVGIGTSSPARKLTIYESSGNAVLQLANNISGVGSQDGFLAYTDGTNVGLENKENGFLSLATNAAERMRITSAGNVGIGTSSPSEKLEVSGKILATGGQVRAGSYLESFPSFSFANDTDTGMFSDTANQLEFSTGGTSRMAINSSGSVGIGNTSPSGKLHVYDSGTDTYGTQPIAIFDYYDTDDAALRYSARIGDGSTTFKTFVTNAAPDFLIVDQDNTAGRLSFQVQGNAGNIESLAVDSTGLVGIGTTSPDNKLHVQGSAQLGDNSDSNGDLTFSIYSGERLVTAGTSTLELLAANASDAIWGRAKLIVTSPTAASSALAFHTNVSASATAERMRIHSNGNLGIGTSSPSEKLEVVGDILIHNGGDSTLYLGKGAEGVDGVTKIKSVQTGSDTDELGLAFNVHPSATGSASSEEAMRIDHNKNVGIGTTSPAANLHVESSAPEFRLSQSGTAKVRLRTSGDNYINTGQNLGIGTSSPDAKLSIDGGTDNLLATFKSTDDLAYMSFQDSGTTSNTSVALGANDNNLVFFTGTSFGSERARIDTSGNFLVGKTSADSATTGVELLQDGLLAATRAGNVAIFNRTTSNGQVVQFRRDNSIVGSVSVTTTATTYNTTSDARLKDITGEARGLEVINELNPVAYDWKADGKSDEGLIAQEVKELVPNAVSETEEGYYQMDYSKLVTPLIKAVQELTAKVESLEAQLTDK